MVARSEQRATRTASRWRASQPAVVAACAVAASLLVGSALLARDSGCGCPGGPPAFVESLRDERVEAVVLAYVAVAEGSFRPAPASAGGQPGHPFPWLCYLMVVERSWKGELGAFWMERPWGRCGSVLWPGQRYLVAVPASRDPDATVLRGEAAATLTACHALARADQASDQVAALGPPRAEHDLGTALQREMPTRLGALIATRRQCLPAAGATPAIIEMVPGEWTPLEVHAAGLEQTWSVGQDAIAPDGRDAVLLAAHNPGPCWWRVEPEVRARWAVEGSARRLLGSSAGLTFREGWVPPYWRGVLSLGADLPWIRQARWRIEPFATPPTGRPPPRSPEALGTATLRLGALDPEPGSFLEAASKVRGRLTWTGELAGGMLVVKPVFAAADDRLVEVDAAGTTVEWPIAADRRTVDFEIPLEELFARHHLTDPLQLRFVAIERSRDGSAEPVDSTGPIAYLRGEEPAREPVPAPARGTWYSGGDGADCADAIVIRGARSVEEGIAGERAWWRNRHPGSEMTSQGASPPFEPGGPAYDHITLKLRDGSETTLCFEITGFWGAPTRVCPEDRDCE
ncbi:MAG TPA: hypothetical protein VMT85_17705 [Thermoanaerobaculia bacterium]|nr:hypothetical protein [Thermoanaerobaculia bacterium]